MAEKKENKLEINRKSLKASVARIETFVKQFEDGDIEQLAIRYTTLNELMEKYDTCQKSLEEIDFDKHCGDRAEIEEICYFIKATIEKINKQRERQNLPCDDKQLVAWSDNESRVKLPLLDIPKFSGNYIHWLGFRDLFISLIHQSKRLSEVDKLHYLKTSLNGEALQIVSSFNSSAESYSLAWNLLNERYNNEEFIVNSHLEAIFDQPQIMKESVTSLRNLITQTKQNVQSLEAQGLPVKHWDAIIIFLLKRKLDNSSRREWELSKNSGAARGLILDELLKFLEQRCFALEAIHGVSHYPEQHFQDKSRRQMTHMASEQYQQNACILCKSQHTLSQCDTFLNQNVNERIESVKKLGLCFNCLKANHFANQCKSTFTCRTCKRRHHTLIHIENVSTRNIGEENVAQNLNAEAQSNVALHNMSQPREILLATAVIKIQDSSDEWHLCRTLLDSGSQTNFISKTFFESLGFRPKSKNLPLSGINQIQTRIHKSIELRLTSRVSSYQRRLEFLILENITNELPTRLINYTNWKLPRGISLADPQFNIPGKIEMLLGAEIFFDILCNEQLRPGKNMPIMQNTEFGWVVSGKTFSNQGNDVSRSCYLTIEPLDSQLRKFWEIEEMQNDKIPSPEEIACEAHFEANTTRDETGRFIVKLPFKSNEKILGESYNTALKRFNHLEKKFTVNSALKDHYIQFIDEYIQLGHMRELNIDDKQIGYYLPHHAVFKESSLTTKTRVVFDASALSSTGVSLNDKLLVGPTIQDSLFSILTRFRMHAFVLTADIEKMYRQVRLNEEDQIYQKILWRKHPDHQIKTYCLGTVTYGTAPAPFLAVRCLHQLAEMEAPHFPQASAILKRDFYVDDLLTGGDDFKEILQLKTDLANLLQRGGFRLRKWLSNEPQLLSEMSEKSEDPLLHLDISQTIKTLGLYWNAELDVILYTTNSNTENITLTKRYLLSQIAKLFDPLGLLGPVICKAKILMQELWQIKTSWDEQVPEHISKKWREYNFQLNSLLNLKIPRRVLINMPVNLQIHGFCDASEVSYGAAIYIRSSDIYNNHKMQLVCSKSRVAPLKKLSIPRLELCAALLLANLYHTSVNAFNLKFNEMFLWSDSTITLYWINTPVHKLKTFIANRVTEIQNLTDMNDWRHISSSDNPADILSRGCLAEQLIHLELWWNGPTWITSDEHFWPTQEFNKLEFPDELSELKLLSNSSHVAVEEACDLFPMFSSFNKLQRVTAYCLRFINNIKSNRELRKVGTLTVIELQSSLYYLIKKSQQECFTSDIQNLQKHNKVMPGSQLRSLYPFLAEDGILRVGGRLENLDVLYEQKHQIILPSKHVFTKLLVRNEHIKLCHSGTQAVLNSIRQKYWPINGRNIIRAIIHSCHKCFRFRMAQTEQTQLMGNLPKCRIQVTRPFLNSGVDYGGPIYVKQGTHRKSPITKAYIALFICMATKAIHLELVSSLSTADFLSAFRRFTSRRGKCANIYSDNGTNFKGAYREMRELQKLLRDDQSIQKICNSAATYGIQWHFIPPNSPNFGGLWEAGIKSVKFHIKRVIGETRLTFEEMYTLLVQIEACVNSRPLTPIHDDPTDFSPLTPAHFLIGSPLTQSPDQNNVMEIPTNRLSRWQVVQKMSQHFWKKWSREYLHNLQQRFKWPQQTPNLCIGDMVIIKEDNITPLQWKIARGRDNLVRVATVRSSSGLLKRPITKLCLLPKDE